MSTTTNKMSYGLMHYLSNNKIMIVLNLSYATAAEKCMCEKKEEKKGVRKY